MQFLKLKQRTSEVLGRDLVSLAYDLAKNQLDNELRIVDMEKTAKVNTVNGNLTLPDDFIELKLIKNVATGEFLTPISHERLVGLATTGIPLNYVVGNNYLMLNPKPNDGHSIEIGYYAKLASLENDDDTNAALQGSAFAAYVYAALAHHAKLIRDNVSAATWSAEASQSILMANKAALSSRFDGGSIQIPPIASIV